MLVWARFPYYTTVPVAEGVRVRLLDARYGDRVGSATMVVPREGRGGVEGESR